MIRTLTPTLIVADVAASLAFWSALPGFSISFHMPPDWAELIHDTGERLALRRGEEPCPALGGAVGLLEVEGLGPSLAEHGARVRASERIGGQRVVWYEGPEGSRFYVWGPDSEPT